MSKIFKVKYNSKTYQAIDIPIGRFGVKAVQLLSNSSGDCLWENGEDNYSKGIYKYAYNVLATDTIRVIDKNVIGGTLFSNKVRSKVF